jgi:hypothetical protein
METAKVVSDVLALSHASSSIEVKSSTYQPSAMHTNHYELLVDVLFCNEPSMLECAWML